MCLQDNSALLDESTASGAATRLMAASVVRALEAAVACCLADAQALGARQRDATAVASPAESP